MPLSNMPFDEAARIKFPHLLPGEASTWRAFLRRYASEYDRFDYDVHLGQGSLPQEEPPARVPASVGDMPGTIATSPKATPTVYAENFRWLTRKRADVIGWQGTKPTIFEVRPRASLPLLGQLEGYRYLWMRANPDSIPPVLVLVTEFVQPDDAEIFSAHGVGVVVVGASSTSR